MLISDLADSYIGSNCASYMPLPGHDTLIYGVLDRSSLYMYIYIYTRNLVYIYIYCYRISYLKKWWRVHCTEYSTALYSVHVQYYSIHEYVILLVVLHIKLRWRSWRKWRSRKGGWYTLLNKTYGFILLVEFQINHSIQKILRNSIKVDKISFSSLF